ncbi:MAG: hypothetical protein WD468_10855 [Pirellulales bacterium]
MNYDAHASGEDDSVEMPRPTAAPLVLAVGILLLAMGVATRPVFLAVGAVVFIIGLARWINQLLPGRGHEREPFVAAELRSQPPTPAPGEVAKLRSGMPGYRLRLPVKVHPVSAGIKGGLVGGLVMPLPALVYGVLSGHGVWWPVNLLAGMVLPGVGDMTTAELQLFHPTLFVVGVVIHLVVSLIMGLMYGVLMPTLPSIRKPLAWGALLMPLLWTAVSYIALGRVNPELRNGIEWPWFVVSQLVFGVVTAVVFMQFEHRGAIPAGLLGGLVGGLLMPIPAILWSLATGHGLWYPANLLSAMALHHTGVPTLAELKSYHADWIVAALVVHAVLSLSFGLALALVLPRVPAIPAPLAWGGLLLPLLWTGMSYGLMGVVNPVLQVRVEWPWFIASQFVFGIVAAIVVVRSEQVYIAPAGPGPGRLNAEPESP